MAFVQPFRYTLLLWAAALGWLCFGETPDVPTIVGSVILVGAGYLNVRLEQRRAADERSSWCQGWGPWRGGV